MLLKHYLDQGLRKSVVARQLGIDRRTINRWIAEGQLERDVDTGQVPRPLKPGKPAKLEAFKPIIDARLERYPELTAVRLFDEVKAAGYTGGISQLRAYIARVRPRATPGAAGALRDGSGSPGAGRLRRVHLSDVLASGDPELG